MRCGGIVGAQSTNVLLSAKTRSRWTATNSSW